MLGHPGFSEYLAARRLYGQGSYEQSAAFLKNVQGYFPSNVHIAMQIAAYAKFGLIGYDHALQSLGRLVVDLPFGRVRLRIACALAGLIWERRALDDLACNLAREIAASRFCGTRQILRAAALLEDAGHGDEAVDIVERAYRLDPATVKEIGHLKLVLALRQRGRFWARYSDVAASIETHLEMNKTTFSDIIAKSGDALAVVANGPSLVGSGLGEAIDARAAVIRFNNFATSGAAPKDRGDRTDIWVRHHTSKHVPLTAPSGLQLIVVLGHGVETRFSNGIQSLAGMIALGFPVQTVPADIYVDLFTRLDAAPSAGLIGVAWAASCRGPLKREQIFGYDLSENDRNKTVYSRGPETGKRPSRHNWSAETHLLNTFLEKEQS